MNSRTYYNEIAEDYSDLLKKRASYLLAVEKEICLNTNINNFLDLGCGDGTRSFRLIESLRPKKSVLIDESEEMIKIARQKSINDVEILNEDFLEFDFGYSFDLITCLWNVFGHLPDKYTRLSFLKKIYDLLEVNGVAYLDINNRYNINNYGFFNVFKSVFKDNILKNGLNGHWRLNTSNDVYSTVYIHKPNELDVLIKEAGFKTIEKSFFDYDTGKKVDTFWKGQILYKLEK